MIDPDELRYLWSSMTMRGLATHFGVSMRQVQKAARTLALPPRTGAEGMAHLSTEQKLDAVYRVAETTDRFEDIAKDIGVSWKILVDYCRLQGVSRKGMPKLIRRVAQEQNPTPRRHRSRRISAVVSGYPTEEAVKRLMRKYIPVCRAVTVDPKADPGLWIVGRRTMTEAAMRELAAK